MKKTMKTKHFIIAFFTLVLAVINANANNMLVQNVTTLNDNPTAKTVQVQFDLSWDNSWRDSINWDAAWIFLKFKDANGLWQHAKLNTNGFQNGSGTSNTVQVTSDNVGAWVYRDTRGSGTFNSTTMQLQWNYGLSGLTKVTGLEVRVFAVEMVYVPEGEFNVAKSFYVNNSLSAAPIQTSLFNAPGNNFPVINTKTSPTLVYTVNFYDVNSNYTTKIDSIKIKGDVGIDTNNNGVIDNITYPTGYKSFFCYKYEMTEQQYADFLNTLTTDQITKLGISGTLITLNNGQYFSSAPNKACSKATEVQLLSYADWSGLRPMSFLEFNKASYGPLTPVLNTISSINGYAVWGTINTRPASTSISTTSVGINAKSNTTSKDITGASYYGILELTGSTFEPIVDLRFHSFTNQNGNGILSLDGTTDNQSWNTSMILFIDQLKSSSNSSLTRNGFRYVRSAE